ncbi:13467_t:CDS:1, partial [Dentiscutata heterogama]
KKEENLSTTPLVIVSIKDCKVDEPAKALKRSVALSIRSHS